VRDAPNSFVVVAGFKVRDLVELVEEADTVADADCIAGVFYDWKEEFSDFDQGGVVRDNEAKL
jgi:hypothetical protein